MRVYGMLWIAHGSRDPLWVAMLEQAFESVSAQWGGPAYLSFLELVEGRLIQDGIDTLESQGVTDLIVVPLFVSSGSTHTEEIAWALGAIPVPYHETDLEPYNVSAKIHWCGPIDEANELLDMVTDRVKSLSTKPEEEVLLLVGHGSVVPLFGRAWAHQLDKIGNHVLAQTGIPMYDFGTIMPDTIGTKVAEWNRKAPQHTVLVVPVFISPGFYTNKKIPMLLQGTNHRYSKDTLLPDERVAQWAIRIALQRRAMEEATD